MPDLVGHTLGQYRIVEQIGLGGMATVYKAYQPALDRYVAIKVLPAYYAHEPGFAERFTREAKAVAKLTHPHVLPIYDFGQEGSLSYIVMQCVDAGTLKDMLGQPISLITAADVLEQIADAMDYAHDQGIIHRDVKPSNVLMDRGRWVLLSDFGLAKMVEGSIQLTGSGVGVGTPAYMAPEQGQGLKVDRRADIYSLGIILYEMVTGRVPFEAETPMAIVVKHITEALPLPRTIKPDLPEPVERIIMKALAKNPDDRYETAGKMAVALRKAVAGLDTAVAEAVPAPIAAGAVAHEAATVLEEGGATQIVPSVPAVPKRKGFPIWAIAAVVGILLLIFLVGFLALARRVRSQRLERAAATLTVVAQAAITTEEPSGSSGGAVTPTTSQPSSSARKTPDVGQAEMPVDRALAFIEQNPPIFEDDFSSPDPGWRFISDGQGQEGFYEDGAYVLRVPEIEGGREYAAGVLLPLDEAPADFILQVDMEPIMAGPGANWAVEFRAQPESRLYVGLNAHKRAFSIGFIESGAETGLARGLVDGYKPDQVAQVMLIAMGPHVALYIDGQQVGVARTELEHPGRIGFSVINTGDPMASYRFDNVRLWDLTLPVKPSESGGEKPIFEDFEDGRADGWELMSGWEVIREEDGNHVLQSGGLGGAILREGKWDDLHLGFRVRSLDGDFHIDFRGASADPSGLSYLAHFHREGVVLHKKEGRPSQPVAHEEFPYVIGDWNEIEILAVGGHIEIIVNGKSVLTYDDPDPRGPGVIAFESVPPNRYLIDDFVIEPAKP